MPSPSSADVTTINKLIAEAENARGDFDRLISLCCFSYEQLDTVARCRARIVYVLDGLRNVIPLPAEAEEKAAGEWHVTHVGPSVYLAHRGQYPASEYLDRDGNVQR